MARPSIDVIVPFLGTDAALAEVLQRLATIKLRDDDRLMVVDNRPTANAPNPTAAVVGAPLVQSSYHARNEGARRGGGTWLLFLDGDVIPPSDLLERYFERPIDDRVAVLAGGIEDLAPPQRRTLAERYAHLTTPLSDSNTWRPGFEYAQTANVLVRRAAFEEVGGFEEVRSGGDADLCFRLAGAGWRVERRRDAVVQHVSRTTVRGLVHQYSRYGAGAAWLEARYPGFLPPWSTRPLLIDVARRAAAVTRSLASRDPDTVARTCLDSVCHIAFQVGRRRPNKLARVAGGR